MSNKSYDKSDWRDRNITFVKERLKGLPPFLWVELFGRSGDESLKAVVEKGVIPSPDYFYGIDNDAQVITDYYASAGLPVEKAGPRRLCYGDYYAKSKEIAKTHVAPIGVFNLDLEHGPSRIWSEGSTQLLTEALEFTMRKTRKCVLIWNCSAERRYLGGGLIPDRVQEQYEKLTQFRDRLAKSGVHLHMPSVAPRDVSNDPIDKGKWRPIYSDNPLVMEVYVSQDKHIPMLTTRLIATRN